MKLGEDCPSEITTSVDSRVKLNPEVLNTASQEKTTVKIVAIAQSAGGLSRLSVSTRDAKDRVVIEFSEREKSWRSIIVNRETAGFVKAVLEYANQHLAVESGGVVQTVGSQVQAVINE